MMRILILALLTLLAAGAVAEDLVEVTLHSHLDAEALRSAPATPIAVISNTYLVLAERDARQQLEQTALDPNFIARDIDPSLLTIDRSPLSNADRHHPVLYDRHGLRVVALPDRQALSAQPYDLMPINRHPIPIRYIPPRSLPPMSTGTLQDIDTLLARVSEDSLRAYTERLEAFYRRLTGTDSSYAARDWIAAKFEEFGYDSVVLDPFTGSQLPGRIPVQSYNVVACKPGTVYPEQEIIIGGHFDAVPDCPGADDNASGTAGTLEIARVVAELDLPMTIKFIAFDSEESWLWGSYHYADSIGAEGAEIVLMINLDMIGHITNTNQANLYWGADDIYAQLWGSLGPTYGGISAAMMGHTASDQLPFIENGYDAIFVQERIFSTHYHRPSDSTVYMNFEYMTRMVKVSLATAHAVWNRPPPVNIAAIYEPGDGQLQLIEWRRIHSPLIDHYRVFHYPVGSPGSMHSYDVPATDSTALITGLTEEIAYAVYVRAYDTEGQSAYAIEEETFTPRSRPVNPYNLTALPVYRGIRLTWQSDNRELDFRHFAVLRDAELAGTTLDTTFLDTAPNLGDDLHQYLVAAVDSEFNYSDVYSMPVAETRAATLAPGRILAINRDNAATPGADVALTGEFLRTALDGADFDYRSDSAYGDPAARTRLHELVSYELIVVAAETFNDNIAFNAAGGGLLDTLTYYLSLGGKLLVFGRFGPSGFNIPIFKDYATNSEIWDDAYADVFHIKERCQLSVLASGQPYGDLVGAQPQQPDYPVLVWDSLRTALHEPALNTPYGICGGSFVILNSTTPDILYTYDSGIDDTLSEGQVVAWRYLGDDYRYIWFDLPLSFFEESAAIATLRRAVTDLTGIATVVDPDPVLPGAFTLAQNYPNPFNPTTTIRYSLPTSSQVKLTVHNLLGQTVRVLVDRHQSAGLHEITWDGVNASGKAVATGIYLYRLETETHSAAKKMLLIK